MNEKFLRNVVNAVDRWADKESARGAAPVFGGEPGTPVSAVDPEDLKAVWDYSAEARRKWGSNGAIEISIFERLCKPAADVQAVCHRSMMLSLVAMIVATEQLCPNEYGTLDSKVFKAAAEIPMKWMGVGTHQSLPFDIHRFLQLCA